MKNFSIVAVVVLLAGMLCVSQVFAFSLIDPATGAAYFGPAKFKFSDRTVGREYYYGIPTTPNLTQYTPETTGTWMAPSNVSKGLQASNNVLTDNMMGTGDNVEDSWGGLYVTSIIDPADESIVYWSPSATEQISGVMYGFDDTYLRDTSAGGAGTAFELMAVGGKIDLYLDNPTTGTAFSWDPDGGGLAYENYTGDGGHWATHMDNANKWATDGTKFLSLDAVGGIRPGMFDGAGNPVTRFEQSNALTAPWTGDGSGYLDVVRGVNEGDYAWMFDCDIHDVDIDGDTVIDHQADFYVMFDFHSPPKTGENIYGMDAISDDPALTAAVPEPATMLLLGSGLIGLAGFGRKKKFFKKS